MSVRFRAGALAIVVAGVLSTATAAGAATTWTPTATQALHLVQATDIGALATGTPLRLSIGLKVQNPAGLAAITRAVNTPGSPQYGQFLSPSQFTAAYAPSAAQVSAVTSYLAAEGFTNVSVEANRLLITADATAGQAERAFNTQLERFSQFGNTVYANVAAAEVPSALAGTVLSVLGLNDTSVMTTPPKTKAAVTPTNCQTTTYALCAYNPAGFRLAYDAGSLTGASTAIAIMAEGDLTGVVSDLRKAEAAFGEPQVPVSIVHVGLASPDTSGADEWDLDSQYSTGLANKVSRLYLYDTTTLTDSDIALEFNRWASQDVAKAASASFGECEATPYADGFMVTNDEIMNEAAAQGQTMHASSGDTGGQSCAVAPTNGAPESGLPEVNYPCSSPYIVCVGGTSLFANTDGSYNSEIGWVAGGGGNSDFESSPYWQACVTPTNLSMNEIRDVPDIAMDADENTGATVYVNGTPETVGGTSLSSPLALGAWAIMESSTSGNRLGFASPLLYSLYPTAGCVNGVPAPQTSPLGTASNDPSYPLHDVSVGSNVAYPNTPGWDYVTGLGTYDLVKTARVLDKVKLSTGQ